MTKPVLLPSSVFPPRMNPATSLTLFIASYSRLGCFLIHRHKQRIDFPLCHYTVVKCIAVITISLNSHLWGPLIVSRGLQIAETSKGVRISITISLLQRRCLMDVRSDLGFILKGEEGCWVLQGHWKNKLPGYQASRLRNPGFHSPYHTQFPEPFQACSLSREPRISPKHYWVGPSPLVKKNKWTGHEMGEGTFPEGDGSWRKKEILAGSLRKQNSGRQRVPNLI